MRFKTVWRHGILDRPHSRTMTGGIEAILAAISAAAPYSAGLAAGGGAADGGVPGVAFAAAALFSTMATEMIEPSYSASKGIASEAWLMTSGGVRTAAMIKAITMK